MEDFIDALMRNELWARRRACGPSGRYTNRMRPMTVSVTLVLVASLAGACREVFDALNG
jgi:hypothetical protein